MNTSIYLAIILLILVGESRAENIYIITLQSRSCCAQTHPKQTNIAAALSKMISFKNLLWTVGVLQVSLTDAATVYLAGDSTMARKGGGKGVSDGMLLRFQT